MHRLIAALTLVFAMTLLAPTANATPADTEEMGVESAGAYLIKHLCKAGRADDRFEQRVWGERKTISHAEVRRRLPEIKRHTRTFADAYFDLALALDQPPAAWPAEASSLADRLASSYLTYSSRLYSAAAATFQQGWSHHWRRAKAVHFGMVTERLRVKLEISSAEWHC